MDTIRENTSVSKTNNETIIENILLFENLAVLKQFNGLTYFSLKDDIGQEGLKRKKVLEGKKISELSIILIESTNTSKEWIMQENKKYVREDLNKLPARDLYILYKNTQSKRETPKIKPSMVLSKHTTNRELTREITGHLEGQKTLFFKQNEHKIIEINSYYDKILKKEITGFIEVSPVRLINFLEEKIDFFKWLKTENGIEQGGVTPKKVLAEYILNNDIFVNNLKVVNRFMHSRMPFIMNNNFIIPTTELNERMDLYVNKDSPIITEIPFEEAKKNILELFEDFCFKEDIDKTMAIAGLITPACRGLYDRITARTPVFLYLANRERAGKDYLAGMTGIIYEGENIENAPISDNDTHNNNNAEIKKTLFSSLKAGLRRFHSANNKGILNNAVFEQITTSENIRQRLLGTNEELTVPNEMDFSISANTGINWSADLWNRSRPINLFLELEDPNTRNFSKPNLHGYIKENRSLLQSSIISCIKEWYENGHPEGNTFTSFPEWARVVGGIMNFCEFGDPCTPVKDESEGDNETISYKFLFNIMNDRQINTLEKKHTVKEIIDIITELQNSGEAYFNEFDFDKKSDQIRFGINFKKYIGRIFNSIKLIILDENSRASRVKYGFILEK